MRRTGAMTCAPSERSTSSCRAVNGLSHMHAVVLERVVLTPSGNLLACWQVAGGADPAALRRRAPVPDSE